MVFRRFHFLSPVIHSQTHTLKGWPGHRLVKIGLATRPSIAKWQFQNSFLIFLRVWVKLVALFYSDNLIALNSAAVLSVQCSLCWPKHHSVSLLRLMILTKMRFRIFSTVPFFNTQSFCTGARFGPWRAQGPKCCDSRLYKLYDQCKDVLDFRLGCRFGRVPLLQSVFCFI